MWQEIFLEVMIGFFLTVTAALIGYMAKSINDLKALAVEKIAGLESDIKNTNRILSQIIIDLKVVEKQGAIISVLQSQMADLRTDMTQVFERIRKIEMK